MRVDFDGSYSVDSIREDLAVDGLDTRDRMIGFLSAGK
jgi:hypothetical protein